MIAALALASLLAAAPPVAQPPPPRVTQADLDEAVASVRRFEEEARLYRAEVQDLLEKRHGERRRVLADSYERAIRDLELDERQERQDAIAQFEEYLSRHPDDPTFTPDAMFRLGELYYEAANDDYAQALSRWRDEARRAAGEGQEPPLEPAKNYARSIGLYQRLVTGFPDYRFAHGIHYLLGYCLGEMGQGEEAQRVYAQLVARFPKSPFVPEAWVRIGDWHFDSAKKDSLSRAAAAFAHLYDYPDHPLYARAIYKLGWTWYRQDAFQHAVEAFTRLLDHYVAEAKRTGRPPSGDIWPEALQYTAISFSDEKWGGVEKAREWFQSLGGRSYEADVYARLGEIYFEETRYPQAVTAWRAVILKDLLGAESPRVHARIIQAWVRARDPEKEIAERESWLANWDEKSDWWKRHRADPDLAREARDLAEKNLARVGAWHHAQAQAHKAGGRPAAALASYRKAARYYGEYVRRFPHARSAYELSYALADCLFEAGEPARAAAVYAQVRDDPADTRFRADAALAAVISWEAEVKRLEQAGQLAPARVRLSKERKAGAPIQAAPLAPARAGLVRESDALLAKLPEHPKAAATAYRAAELYYAHDDFPEARRRLDEVVARWPRSEVAGYAANLVVESHLSTGDWAEVESSAARLQATETARADPALAASLQKFKLGGRFNRSMQLMEQKRYEEAGKGFIALVAEEPRHEFADKALWNAASCFEHARRFESALRLYERIPVDYPSSPYADESLFRVAWTAENAYDFDKAVSRYLRLVDDYPGSKQRKDALYNAARSLENLQRYDEAARAFGRYAELYPDAEDAARTQFHAALIYEKSREWRREIEALQAFQRRFAQGKEHELIVQSHLKVALAWHALGDEAKAREGYGAAVAEFARRRLQPEAHPRAAGAAAEARFRLLEYDFERYDRIALPATANPKKLKKALEAKLAEMKRVAPLYNEVKKYRRPDWILAAFYRQAFLLERLAQTLYEAPIPPEFKEPGQEEYLAAYQDQLSQFAQPYEDQAVAVYVQAIQAARELHVKNEWTRRVSESLARYRPKEYPILKDARGKMVLEDLSPLALARAAPGHDAPAADARATSKER
ncbi:MAG TPA: tetratricopeptide repeat protein [Anaeromyxobacteraceae bacterium]|nr:tetratricopeptide repeat protein [Anaeromyxobacteraceae bacterium]